MKKTTSALLDLLRILSALVVFSSHCAQFWSDEISHLIRPFAHHAVVVFFVLSGYVIAFSTLTKRWEVGGGKYIESRLSRLYSVVIPALALTITLQIIGSEINSSFYEAMSRGNDAIRYILSILFLQSTGSLSAAPPTNGPLWSLSYEFWYYAIFGAYVFSPGKISRIALVAILSIIAGYKILLLFPCWLIGVALFVFKEKLHFLSSHPRAWLLASISFLMAIIIFLPDFPFDVGRKGLFFSAAFISDWILAFALAAFIATCDAAGSDSFPQKIITQLRAAGDYTFPLYLYHFPVIVFFTATSGFIPQNAIEAILIAIALLAGILILCRTTERMRPFWKHWTGLIAKRISTRLEKYS